MRFGTVILPQGSWKDASRKWIKAEELGFDHAWTYDHLSWRMLADQTWYGTVPILTAAAVVTSTIQLGVWVSSPNFRHPVTFAKDVATIDEISEGRFLLGIGSGGTGFDAYVFGEPDLTPRERHERFVEFVHGLDALLRHEAPGSTEGISFDGDWFTAHKARMVGEPAQKPRVPFLIAANGPKGLKTVVDYGQAWVTIGKGGTPEGDVDAWWAGVGELVRRLEDTAAAAGRDLDSIQRYLSVDGPQYSLESVGAFEDTLGRTKELGFTDMVNHWPRDESIYVGNEAIFDEIMPIIAAERAGN